jgi:hypothetical protein
MEFSGWQLVGKVEFFNGKNSPSAIRGQYPGETMNPLVSYLTHGRYWQATFTTLSYLPWVWLATMMLFVTAVTLQVGHLPVYGQPDPKDTGYLLLFYWPVLLLLPPTLIGPLLWSGLALLRHFFDLPFLIRRQEVLLFLPGWLLFVGLALTDFGGLMTWLID